MDVKLLESSGLRVSALRDFLDTAAYYRLILQSLANCQWNSCVGLPFNFRTI